MKSYLIADTTREEREQIVEESLGNISGSCDGCRENKGTSSDREAAGMLRRVPAVFLHCPRWALVV